MTEAERVFWSKVRMRQLHSLQFYRQKIIGDYIVDFYCPRAGLVIEIDGSQHFADDGIKNDRIRDEFMQSLGLKVVRFNNREVLMNIEGVLQRVDDYCRQIPLSPPLTKGGSIRNLPLIKGD
ncbi:MAG: endonuclease domain-containing protein [Dehalococcoidia bacterium]